MSCPVPLGILLRSRQVLLLRIIEYEYVHTLPASARNHTRRTHHIRSTHPIPRQDVEPYPGDGDLGSAVVLGLYSVLARSIEFSSVTPYLRTEYIPPTE